MQNQSNQQFEIDGSPYKVAIIVPCFNTEICEELCENAKKELIANKVKPENISITKIAGALELPFAAKKIIEKEKVDAVIALGAIIRGETSHYDMVCNETFRGLMDVQLQKEVPVIFGVLTCETMKQARIRSSEKGQNKGKQVARAALLQLKL